MKECQLLESIANLILQSITIWEDVHRNALTISSEYNTFWELLDDTVRMNALTYQRQNKEARLAPFSISHLKHYELLMTKESFNRSNGLHWKEQLKIILADNKFRGVLTNLIIELRSVRETGYGYVADRAAIK